MKCRQESDGKNGRIGGEKGASEDANV